MPLGKSPRRTLYLAYDERLAMNWQVSTIREKGERRKTFLCETGAANLSRKFKSLGYCKITDKKIL